MQLTSPSKPGPPKTDIALDQIETLAAIGCTLDEIAAVVGLSVRTLQRRENEDSSFLEALERGRAKGRASLRRLQWEAAKSGNITAQIWLGKQLLGQRSYEREDPAANQPAAVPPLIIQTYIDDPPVQAAVPNIPESGTIPGSGSGT